MQIILASAKIMHDSVKTGIRQTTPRFEAQAESLARDMAGYDEETLAGMLKCSHAIATQNKLRFMRFFDEDRPTLPAILAYNGQAYKHLKADTLSKDDIAFAARHLWITSFLYGLLRPTDGIRPYRLEGSLTLPTAQGGNLFEIWKPLLTDVLIESVKADDGILLHLATTEYQHLFDWKRVCQSVRVIQPLFYVRKGDTLKMQAVWAKTCRGAMTRYVIKNRVTTEEALHAFSYEGFRCKEGMAFIN